MQYAYYLGMAHLVVQPLDTISISRSAERVMEAFRISLYDKRTAESIVEFFSSDLNNLQINMERQANNYIILASTSDPKASEYSWIGFEHYLLEYKNSFTEEKVKKLTDFQNEVQKECLLVFIEMMMGKEDYKKMMIESKIKGAEGVKQFAIRYADCPGNLDSAYFRERQVNKKVSLFTCYSGCGSILKCSQGLILTSLSKNVITM